MTEQNKSIIAENQDKNSMIKKNRKLHRLGFVTKTTYTNIEFIEKIETYAKSKRCKKLL